MIGKEMANKSCFVFFSVGSLVLGTKVVFPLSVKKSDENSLSQPNQDILAMNYE